VDIRFGYGLISCQRYPGDGRTDVDRYREALDMAAEAEDLGFDSVWTSEHHFADDAYMPSVIAMSAAIAERSSRIGIATTAQAEEPSFPKPCIGCSIHPGGTNQCVWFRLTRDTSAPADARRGFA
jgi:Luciferase-like monooxygenase